MEFALSRGGEGEAIHAKLRRQLKDEEWNPVGIAHNKPLLDSRKYEIEYADGYVDELPANTIAENLIAHVDDEGCTQMMLDKIVDHRVLPNVIPQSQGTYVNSYGVKRRKTTTRDWELLVEWKVGSTDWVAMKDLKESYPIELGHFAIN
jgi:hypothetical protein